MIVAVGAGGNGGRREEGEGRMGLCAGHVWGRDRKKGQECSLSSGLTFERWWYQPLRQDGKMGVGARSRF